MRMPRGPLPMAEVIYCPLPRYLPPSPPLATPFDDLCSFHVEKQNFFLPFILRTPIVNVHCRFAMEVSLSHISEKKVLFPPPWTSQMQGPLLT